MSVQNEFEQEPEEILRNNWKNSVTTGNLMYEGISVSAGKPLLAFDKLADLAKEMPVTDQDYDKIATELETFLVHRYDFPKVLIEALTGDIPLKGSPDSFYERFSAVLELLLDIRDLRNTQPNRYPLFCFAIESLDKLRKTGDILDDYSKPLYELGGPGISQVYDSRVLRTYDLHVAKYFTSIENAGCEIENERAEDINSLMRLQLVTEELIESLEAAVLKKRNSVPVDDKMIQLLVSHVFSLMVAASPDMPEMSGSGIAPVGNKLAVTNWLRRSGILSTSLMNKVDIDKVYTTLSCLPMVLLRKIESIAEVSGGMEAGNFNKVLVELPEGIVTNKEATQIVINQVLFWAGCMLYEKPTFDSIFPDFVAEGSLAPEESMITVLMKRWSKIGKFPLLFPFFNDEAYRREMLEIQLFAIEFVHMISIPCKYFIRFHDRFLAIRDLLRNKTGKNFLEIQRVIIQIEKRIQIQIPPFYARYRINVPKGEELNQEWVTQLANAMRDRDKNDEDS